MEQGPGLVQEVSYPPWRQVECESWSEEVEQRTCKQVLVATLYIEKPDLDPLPNEHGFFTICTNLLENHLFQ